MSYIPKYKIGSCECGASSVQGRKVGKTFYCMSCYQKNKTHEQIGKAIKRDEQRTAITNAAAKLGRVDANTDANRKMSKGYKSKSELLRDADRLFADFIKARDTDKNGMVYCPCCKGKFNAESVDSNGSKIINCMHFVDRDVYSLRYDEDAAHAGHAGCNKTQHYQPSGKEYQNFKQFLEDKFGIHAVHEMELQKRKINKISEQDLKYVIEYYTELKQQL